MKKTILAVLFVSLSAQATTYDTTSLVDGNNVNTSTVTSTSTVNSNNTNANTNTNTNYNINSGTSTVNNNTALSGSVTYTNNNVNSGTVTYNNNNVSTSTSVNTNNNNNVSTSTNINTNNSTSSATSVNQNIQSGDMTNRNFSDTTVTQKVIQPPPTAMAPTMMSGGNSDLCSTGSSASVQTQIFGVASGGTVRDLNCERLKLSKTLYDMGMKVAAVATMCQDRRVFDAMMDAGTPCPFEGKIGADAKQAWLDNPDKIPAVQEEKVDDTYKKVGMGAVLGIVARSIFLH
mgnify:CR=1 FL=1